MSDSIARPLELGATFLGRYQIVRCINAGGMGAVYEVIHLETKRRRALKVMLPSVLADPDLRARFRLEATVTAEIETEHIVETFDAGVDPETGAPFLVMELLKGEDLQAHMERHGRIPAGEVVVLMHQVALALDKTHAAGIVHRDLKPENLFLSRRDDGSPRVKVLDFGIAKIVAQSTQANATRSMGTPLYMSPEQLQGDGTIGPRADLYALGHIAFTLLVASAYWDAEARSTEGIYPFLVKVMVGAKELASIRAARHGVALGASFDRWFEKATAAHAQDRFGKASEQVSALARALGVPAPSLPVAAEEAPEPSTAPRAQAVSAGALGSGTSEPFAPTRLSASGEPAASGARGASGTFAATSERVAARRKRSIAPFAAGTIVLTAVLVVAALARSGSRDSEGASASAAPAAPSSASAANAAPTPSLSLVSSAIPVSALPDVVPAERAPEGTAASSTMPPAKPLRQPVTTATPSAARAMPPPPASGVRKPRDFGDRK